MGCRDQLDGTEAASDALAMGLLGEISAEGSDAVHYAVAFIEPLGKTARCPCGDQNRDSRSRALAPSTRSISPAQRVERELIDQWDRHPRLSARSPRLRTHRAVRTEKSSVKNVAHVP